MKTIVGYPGTGIFAQQIACAFYEHDALHTYFTSFAYRETGMLATMLTALPGSLGMGLHRDLLRRTISEIPRARVKTSPIWEVMRSIAAQSGASASTVDRIWDHMARDFTRKLATQMHAPCEAVYAYEYTALEAFEVAGCRGIARILDLPSLSSHLFEEIKQRELSENPALRAADASYFDKKYPERQARRDQEIALADVIMTNSKLTARSHIEHGADPAKVFTVPLAAPPTIARIARDESMDRPLQVVWAGMFSIRKGAHYFLDAWRALNPGASAMATVYGANALPEFLERDVPDNLSFAGSVPQPDLFAHFETSDVLIFPTLSDGFGMVISEAFAHGLPVITTDQAGAADLVEHEMNGLIIPAGDANAIRGALDWCLDNREQLHAMRHAALEAAKNWQWADYRKCLIGTLDNALSRAGFIPTFNKVS